jgi:hypothetical protein
MSRERPEGQRRRAPPTFAGSKKVRLFTTRNRELRECHFRPKGFQKACGFWKPRQPKGEDDNPMNSTAYCWLRFVVELPAQTRCGLRSPPPLLLSERNSLRKSDAAATQRTHRLHQRPTHLVRPIRSLLDEQETRGVPESVREPDQQFSGDSTPDGSCSKVGALC